MSEEPVYGEEAHAAYTPAEAYGRTGWDTLFFGRKVLLVILAMAAGGLALWWYARTYGAAPVQELLREYWPALPAPLVGWLLGRRTALALCRPDGRVLVQLDVEHHLFRAVFVPETVYRLMCQSGNGVVYHSPAGAPVYLVLGLDLNDGFIDYGWAHELDPLSVMTRENAYVRWDRTLREVLEENLELMVHPTVIGLGYARDTLHAHLDALAGQLGLGGTDLGGHSAVAGPDGRPMDPEYREGRAAVPADRSVPVSRPVAPAPVPAPAEEQEAGT